MNNSILKKLVIFMAILGSGVLGALTMAQKNASAINLAESNRVKALGTALVDCYDKKKFVTPLTPASLTGKTTNIMKSGTSLFVPMGFNGSTVKMECINIVGKLLEDKGGVPNGGVSSDERGAFLQNMGYTANVVPTGGECISFTYDVYNQNLVTGQWSSTPSASFTTNKLCADEINANGTIAVDKLTIPSGTGSTEYMRFRGAKKGSVTVDCNGMKSGDGGCGKVTFTKGSTKWEDLVKLIKENVLANRSTFKAKYSSSEDSLFNIRGYPDFNVDSVNRESKASVTATYNMVINDAAKMAGTNFLLGTGYSTKPTFNASDQFVMYQNYLLDYFGAEVHCTWNADQIAANSKKYNEVRLYADGAMKTCYVKATKNNKKSVGGIDSNSHFGASCNYTCIVNWLKASSVSGLPADSGVINPVEGGTTPSPTPTPNPIDPSGSTADTGTCDSIVKNNVDGKIGAMQWILCPTMDNAKYTASWIDDMTQNWLEIDPSNYTGGNIETVWGMIRNIANVLMIVFLSLVVFSQLTGYGIDNYGIKKMLPRLIVMAIVVNLSLYICQLAIDLSNIAGVGLRNMFGSIGGALSDDNLKGTSFIGTMVTGIFASAGGLSAGVGAGLTAGVTLGAPVAVAVIIAVIVMCLVILVAVAVLFLMLGARQVIVILCIVTAPLAFAAFILPNTQSLFKKWWDLFKAAIIIFPICGALSGISYMLRAMTMANSGTDDAVDLNVWGFAIMMILPYLGFFLMPMLLKNAISGLGKVGGALTSLGNTVRSGGRAIGQGAQKIAQNTDRYKDMQREAQAGRAKRVMQKYGNGEELQKRLEKAKREMESQPDSRKARKNYEGALRDQRRAARASETLRKLGNEDTAAGTILTERQYADTSQMDMENMWYDALVSGDTDRRVALENVIASRFGTNGASGMASRLSDVQFFDEDGKFVGGDNGAMAKSFRSLQSNLAQNNTLSNHMKNKASDAFQMITSGGYGKDNVRHNMSYHTANNGMLSEIKDWATQSTETIRRAAEAGALTPEVAGNILSSQDPAIESGIKSDAGKAEILRAVASGKMPTARDSSSPNAARAASIMWDRNAINPATGHTYIQDAADSYNIAGGNQTKFDTNVVQNNGGNRNNQNSQNNQVNQNVQNNNRGRTEAT